ncbi:MAG: LolA family protein [Bacteroidales bacterium]
MKKLWLLFFIIPLSLSLSAQEIGKGDRKSNEILERLTQKTEAYQTIRAEFAYKMENVEAGVNEQTEGVLLVKGNKYRLDIAGQTVISDGITLWTYIADANEVQINSADESEESISPNKLLSSYTKDYRSKFIAEDFLYGTAVNIIDLTPETGKSFYKVRLIIDKAKDQLKDVTIFEKNGSTFSYVIKKFETNVDADDRMFTFNKSDFPGVEIIDMR